MSRNERDDFKSATAILLAKRVGHRCSNPACRTPTSGPTIDATAANLGVAAHITAASPGGPRFNPSLNGDERSASENGIWLCQQCSRLIDVDPGSFSVQTLHDWKQLAEATAYLELRGFDVVQSRSFSKLEALMPDLISEMRADLAGKPFTREIISFSKKWSYNGSDKSIFTYYKEDHEHLSNKLDICVSYGAIFNITFNSVDRFKISEDFAEYLLGTSY